METKLRQIAIVKEAIIKEVTNYEFKRMTNEVYYVKIDAEPYKVAIT